MLAGAVAEGFGLLMIVPLATIAIKGGDAAIARYAPWSASLSTNDRFAIALGLFLAAMGLRSVLLHVRNVVLANLRAAYEADLSLRAAATLAGRGWPFASRIGQAGMQSLLLNDVPRAGEAASYFQQMAVGATMLIVQLALTLVLSPALTAVALAFLILGWCVSLRFARRGVRRGLAIADAMETSTGSGFRLHAGLKAALAQGTVPAFLAEYRSSLVQTARQLTSFARDYDFVQQSAAFGAAIVAATLLLVGVRILQLPFPVLVASLVLFARMTAPAQLLQNSTVRASAYASAFLSIEARLCTLTSTTPTELPRKPAEWHVLKAEGLGYEHQPGLGLKDASFQLARGAWLGVEGESGSGKTTLVDLVAGLLPATTGSLEIDGKLLEREGLESWRAGIAYVGQEGSVFNDTVRANLLAEGARTDDEGLWRALDLAGLADRVRALAGGLEEEVGDRGSQLSGGERQRLVIARAFLRNPSLMILDEATAALDPAGEAELLNRLKALDPRPAALIIAHRDSTLRHCDSVLSIRHGIVRAGERNVQ